MDNIDRNERPETVDKDAVSGPKLVQMEQGLRPAVVLPVAVLLVLFGTLVHEYLPGNATMPALVEIPSGISAAEIGAILSEKHIIRSPLLFTLAVKAIGKETEIQAGQFLFDEPMSAYRAARKLSSNDRGIEKITITIPEGATRKAIERIVREKLPEAEPFDALANVPPEGYLFPDTYFFYSVATSGQVLNTLRDNFDFRTGALKKESGDTKKNWSEVVVMASIIEKEAKFDEDRPIISGILWKRLAMKMPLQVDASLYYVLGKPSSELTADDLQVDSPYNTYTHRGLPPGAISNPGLEALDAALHPSDVSYLYYLSDSKGKMHYAKTFEEHKLNKAKYLY